MQGICKAIISFTTQACICRCNFGTRLRSKGTHPKVPTTSLCVRLVAVVGAHIANPKSDNCCAGFVSTRIWSCKHDDQHYLRLKFVIEKNVGRLDVSVDHWSTTAMVKVAESLSNLRRHSKSPVPREQMLHLVTCVSSNAHQQKKAMKP